MDVITYPRDNPDAGLANLCQKNIPLAPLLLTCLTLIPAWIRNHMPSNVWDEITYPFLNFNGCTVEV